MKQRIITAAVGLALLLIVLLFFNTLIFNAAVSLLACMAALEILVSAKYASHKLLTAACLLFVAAVPFFRMPGFNLFGRITVLVYLVILFLFLLAEHETLRFEQIGVIFTTSILIPFSFSTLLYIRDQFSRDGLFFVMLVFAGAWFADAGGYFIGRFFGKHKLAPKISPHKTVEGAVGGILFNVFFFLVMGLCYAWYMRAVGTPVTVHYLTMGLLAVPTALIGMLGDLSASMIKRQCGVKDFGTIMPGHGGVMDRFDSVLFVSPFLYVALQFVTLIS